MALGLSVLAALFGAVDIIILTLLSIPFERVTGRGP